MAVTEISKSYNGIVTIGPTVIRRLQTIVEMAIEINNNAIKSNLTKEFEEKLNEIKGTSKSAVIKRAEVSNQRDTRIFKMQGLQVDSEWTVKHSDDSTNSQLNANEVVDLSNLDSRQINGVRVVVSGHATVGIYFRFDARKLDKLSRIDILVKGQEDNVSLLSGKLNEIASSALAISPMRGDSLWPFAKFAVFSIVATIAILKILKLGGQNLSEDQLGYVYTALIPFTMLGGFFLSFLLSYFYPSWNCTIGDGEKRFQRSENRRHNWFQFGFGGIFLAGIVGFIVNKLSSN
jgi:hypothetical protein